MFNSINQYIYYGIYENTLYFPYNKPTIRQYMLELKPLSVKIRNESRDNILNELVHADSNIFITSFILSNIGLCDKALNFLIKKIEQRMDLYIFLSFLSYSDIKINQKYINALYENKLYLIADYKDMCFKLRKPKIVIRNEFRKRIKVSNKIKKQMASSVVTNETVSIIKQNHIHFQDIYPCMSYYFDLNKKCELTKYFIDIYGILEVLYFIESWFIEGIPELLEGFLSKNLTQLTEISELCELMIIYKTISDIRLKNIIENVINIFYEDICEVVVNIDIIPTQKNKYKLDRNETYDYLYFNSINACIINSFTKGVIHLNNQIVEGTFIDKINRINGNNVVLKPKKIIIENQYNLLFSSVDIEGFNAVWNSTNEEYVSFYDRGYLSINGLSKHMLPCYIKYIKNTNEVI